MSDGERHLVLRRACPEHEQAPGILYALADETSGQVFLECDEIEHGWWQPADLDSKRSRRPPTGPRHFASEAEIRNAGWDLSLFVDEKSWRPNNEELDDIDEL